MAEPKNLPIDKAWVQDEGTRSKNHEYKEGEYVERAYLHAMYPKTKYHTDYVHAKREGVEYPFTAYAQIVNSAQEEKQLGKEWKDTPGELGIVTAPDVESVAAERRKSAAAGANWRAAASLPSVSVSEKHLEYANSQGMQLKDLGALYAFLATMTSAQMKSFMDEVEARSNGEEEPELAGAGASSKKSKK